MGSEKRMTVVVVQCRLNSSRLPGKALMLLDNKPIIQWTLEAMKKVPSDEYYIATDKASEKELEKIATKCGWKVFAGSENNVLERFAQIAEITKARTVLRATGDNPFLFYEAAVESLEVLKKINCDYFTFTGLPHGSGIEVYKGSALIQGNKTAENDFEKEHVGPTFYNHKDKYNVIFEPAPAKYDFPKLRTTVDTFADYLRAWRIFYYINNKYNGTAPFTASQIVEAASSNFVSNPVLLVPQVKKTHGTGHFRRCYFLAKQSGFNILLPKKNVMKEIADLVENNKTDEKESAFSFQGSLSTKKEYNTIITDAFKLSEEEAKEYRNCGNLVALDEGGKFGDYCDYLINIIPSLQKNPMVNLTNYSLMDLPKNRKLEKCEKNKVIKSALIALGGEDPAKLSEPAALACKEAGLEVHRIISPVENLKEELYKYDLVVTHFGFTAFEAVAAGCAVLLMETSPLHKKLAKKYGFQFLAKSKLNGSQLKKILNESEKLYLDNELGKALSEPSQNLAEFLNSLIIGKRYTCPICQKNINKDDIDMVVARNENKTVRRCQRCSMLYISWCKNGKKHYGEDYFFKEYQAQYGKTYLEDFQFIKTQGERRLKNILKLEKTIENVLDVGCAYGPFLSAVKEKGIKPFGIDVSEAPIKYVKDVLNISAACVNFPYFNAKKELGLGTFDAITMWYVIEHFSNLDVVLKNVNKLLNMGGIFAFSTPSARGVSGIFNKADFFKASPLDHFSIWEPNNAVKILRRYGFTVKKIVSTGHHPERLKMANWIKSNKFLMKVLNLFSHIFKLGDTCEIYCQKDEDL